MKNIVILSTFICFLLISCNNHENLQEHPAYSNPIIEPFTIALQENPKNASLFYERAEALLEINQDSLSLLDMQQAVELEPTNARYLQALGILHLRLNQNEEAIKIFEDYLKDSPGDLSKRIYLSRAYLAENHFEKAQSEIQKVLDQEQENPEALFFAAQIHAKKNDTAHAIHLLETLHANNPNFYAASYQLADWYAATQHPSTISQYEKTFYLDTFNVSPLYEIGFYLEENKDIEAAKQAYIRCLYYDLDFSDAYFHIGKILYSQDSIDKALRHFNLAIKTQIDDAESYYYKGLCFEKLSLKDSAQIAYEQALIFDPKLEAAKKSLGGLLGSSD